MKMYSRKAPHTLDIVFVSYKYSCKRAGVFRIAIIVSAHIAFLNKKILPRSIMLTPLFTSSLQFIPNVQIDGLRRLSNHAIGSRLVDD